MAEGGFLLFSLGQLSICLGELGSESVTLNLHEKRFVAGALNRFVEPVFCRPF